MTDSAASALTAMIRSRQNARLRDLRLRLQNPSMAHDRLIAIEGNHLIEEAQRSGLRFDTLFLREDRITQNIRPIPGDGEILIVAAGAFDHACSTESPQGIAAFVEAPLWTLESLLARKYPRILILAGLQDPGNLGTILRSAEAFGGTGVLLTPGSVSPWNSKALRAAAGSSFRLPIVSLPDVSLLRRLPEQQIPLYACIAGAGTSILDADLCGPIAFVIGNEGAGVPREILPFCQGTLHIPYPGKVESLNAAIAASILLYEASRQRRPASVESKP